MATKDSTQTDPMVQIENVLERKINLFLKEWSRDQTLMEVIYVLRAKIDLVSPNMLTRDPLCTGIMHMLIAIEPKRLQYLSNRMIGQHGGDYLVQICTFCCVMLDFYVSS